MLDVSAGELFVIFIVAAVCLGPERAACFMRRIAGWLDSADARWRDLTRSAEGEDERR